MSSTPAPKRQATPAELGCTEDERFLLELEFVQCLSSPQYLNCMPFDVSLRIGAACESSSFWGLNSWGYRAGSAPVLQGQGLPGVPFLSPILAAPGVQSALGVSLCELVTSVPEAQRHS